ncbi:unnamed protein product [Adineta steineri]|uniref:SCP domain-containing protein n=1 Tax=Adineta steineri TaxID=433720 RepID=A0A813WIJ8_9BILA|nr:unnamed protein product [Adineta steineri]CAF3515066.1 unnamed protein product [Adineta steineri]
MSSMSTRSTTSGRAHYKLTRTVTGTDGKTHTETVEMYDDDAVKLMRGLRSNRDNVPDLDRFGFRPLTDPKNLPQLEQRNHRLIQSLKPKSTSSSLSSSSGAGAAAAAAVVPAPPKRSTVTQSNNEFVQDALQVHNELRRRHGVESLRLNNDLTKLAQQWANHLASTGTLVHSKTKYRNVNVGENLRCQSWSITGKEMTQSWYNECNKYDYRNPSYQPGTGHFTQVIWKDSQEVGFAQAQGTSMIYAVAMYYPPGNYVGDFDRNVFPPR